MNLRGMCHHERVDPGFLSAGLRMSTSCEIVHRLEWEMTGNHIRENYLMKPWMRRLPVLLLTMMLATVAGCGGYAPDVSGAAANSPVTLSEGVRVVRVVETSGDVSVFRDDVGQGISAVQGMNLSGGDGFGTGTDAGALLGLDDDKSLQMGESVRMKVASLVGDALRNGTVIQLEKGTVLFRIKKKLAPGESFEVKTPTCVMGVRGTRFFVSVEDGVTRIGVFEGRVEALPLNVEAGTADAEAGTADAEAITTGAAVSIGPDEWLEISKDASFAALKPEPLSEEHIPAFVTDALLQEPEGVNPRWLTAIEASASENGSEVLNAVSPAGLNEGSGDGTGNGSFPKTDWNLMDGVDFGTPFSDVQRRMGMEGRVNPDQPGTRLFRFERAFIWVMVDADDRVIAYTISGFPLEIVDVSFTPEEWIARTDLDGQPLSAAEEVFGTKGRLSGKWSPALTGGTAEDYVWRVGDGLYLTAQLINGVISSLIYYDIDEEIVNADNMFRE